MRYTEYRALQKLSRGKYTENDSSSVRHILLRSGKFNPFNEISILVGWLTTYHPRALYVGTCASLALAGGVVFVATMGSVFDLLVSYIPPNPVSFLLPVIFKASFTLLGTVLAGVSAGLTAKCCIKEVKHEEPYNDKTKEVLITGVRFSGLSQVSERSKQ